MTQTRDERIAEIKGRRYNRGRQMYIHESCAADVGEPPLYIHSHQCTRKPGHGLGGLFCKQHAKNNPEIENAE